MLFRSAAALAMAKKLSFLVTKSVSQLTSIKAALLPALCTATTPSAVMRAAAFPALLPNFTRSNSSAFAAGDTVYGFQWTKGSLIITPTLMGISNDGKDKAGVDQTVFIDSESNLRLIFAGPNNTKHSAISKDNGTSWSEDKGFIWPKFEIGRAHV